MRGYVAENVPGDGSCLFHSFARHLGVPARALREQVARTLRTLPTMTIEDTTLRDWTLWYADKPIEQYARDIERPGVWGGALEIAIISRLYRRPVHVYEPSADRRNCTRISKFEVPRLRGQETGPPMRLLYMGRAHYMPLFER